MFDSPSDQACRQLQLTFPGYRLEAVKPGVIADSLSEEYETSEEDAATIDRIVEENCVLPPTIPEEMIPASRIPGRTIELLARVAAADPELMLAPLIWRLLGHPIEGVPSRLLRAPYFRDLVYRLMVLPKTGRLATFLLNQDVRRFSQRASLRWPRARFSGKQNTFTKSPIEKICIPSNTNMMARDMVLVSSPIFPAKIGPGSSHSTNPMPKPISNPPGKRKSQLGAESMMKRRCRHPSRKLRK